MHTMQLRRPPLFAIVLLVIFSIGAMLFVYHHRHGVMSRVRALLNFRPPAHTKTVLEAGQRLPVVELTNLAGERLAVTAQHSHILYLNVFTTWCPNCQVETPALEQLHKATASKGVDVVGVDQEEELSPISQFVQRYNLTYPIFLDDQGVTHELMGVRYIPTSFIVDTHGVVRARITGPLSLAQMEWAVDTVRRGGTIASN